MLKVFCEGSKGYINQIDRIKQGFIDNGCQLTSLEEAELIYFNDPNSYDLEVKIKNSKAKVIFNVLDIPFHLIDSQRYDVSRYPVIEMPSYWKKDFNPHNLFDKLKICDAVTCICNEVQWQLKNWGNIESTVIHNPVKDVSYLNLFDHQKFVNKKGNLYKYLYVGRANDPNKRFKIIYETMKLLGDKSDTLAVIGSENPNWGDYYGVVDDINLNIFYNSVEYFMFPSAFKSIGLPALESIIAKTKTIVCNDDPTTIEFWENIGLDSNPECIANAIRSKEWNIKCQEFINSKSEIYKANLNKKNIAKNIINVYHSI